MTNYYHVCNRYIGKHVTIRCRDGQVHRGVIQRVSNRQVFIRPIQRNYGGFGYGYYGYRPGYGYGYGIALGAITGVALASLLLW